MLQTRLPQPVSELQASSALAGAPRRISQNRTRAASPFPRPSSAPRHCPFSFFDRSPQSFFELYLMLVGKPCQNLLPCQPSAQFAAAPHLTPPVPAGLPATPPACSCPAPAGSCSPPVAHRSLLPYARTCTLHSRV